MKEKYCSHSVLTNNSLLAQDVFIVCCFFVFIFAQYKVILCMNNVESHERTKQATKKYLFEKQDNGFFVTRLNRRKKKISNMRRRHT